MTLHRSLLCSLFPVLVSLGCARGVTEPNTRRLELQDVLALPSAIAREPLVIGVQYLIGACAEVTGVHGSLIGSNRLEIEVRARDLPLPAGTVCPAIAFHRDTTFSFVSPPAGELLVVGLQPRAHDRVIERRVSVVAGET